LKPMKPNGKIIDVGVPFLLQDTPNPVCGLPNKNFRVPVMNITVDLHEERRCIANIIRIIMNSMSMTLILSILPGLLAGWLVNYLADVLPATRRFSQPVCPQCGTPFRWPDYLLLRSCQNGHSRTVRVWVVQIILLAASIITWIEPPSKLGYFLGMILAVYFGVVFVIDLEHRLILHPTSIFGAILGLIVGMIAHGIQPTLLGGLGGLLIMLAFYGLGVLFTRIRTKRMLALGQEADDEEALGSGDVILVTILGFIVGWPLIWLCLLYGILLGGFASIFIVLWLFLSGRYKTSILMTFIPYGPYFIITATLIVFFPKFLAMIVPD
jgi:prepilin signal peptidase PulO-like enzyme (type II secretory pathway)